MKKITLLLIGINVCCTLHAQTQIDTSPIYHKDNKVGIGIQTPSQKLHIEDGEIGVGDQSGDNWLRLSQLKSDAYGYDFEHNNASVIVNEQGSINEALILGDVSSNVNMVLFGISHKQGADWIPKMTLTGLGNLGIGILSPTHKLEVAGSIKATEIKVEAQTADFVFEDDYRLKDLSEVEEFINNNKHLPDIPSAKQMEENGIGLSEMNKLLLQKVEELTLYVIDLNKSVNILKTENQRLNKEMENLKFRIKD